MISELRDYLFQKGLPYGLQPLSVMVGPDPTCPSDGYSLHLETRGGPTGKADFGLNYDGEDRGRAPVSSQPQPLSTPAPALAVSSAATVVPGFTADRNGELFTKWRELAVDNFRMHRQLERLTRFDRSPVGPDVRYEVDPSTAAWVPRPPPNEAALRANIVTESIEFTRLTRLLREVEQSQTKTRR